MFMKPLSLSHQSYRHKASMTEVNGSLNRDQQYRGCSGGKCLHHLGSNQRTDHQDTLVPVGSGRAHWTYETPGEAHHSKRVCPGPYRACKARRQLAMSQQADLYHHHMSHASISHNHHILEATPSWEGWPGVAQMGARMPRSMSGSCRVAGSHRHSDFAPRS
jgi:hypothetical protein